jgi:hypothetical protein
VDPDQLVEKLFLRGNVERGVYQRLVAAAYEIAPDSEPRAVKLFRPLAQAILGQHKQLSSRFKIRPTSDDPYKSAGEMFGSLDQQKKAGAKPEIRVYAGDAGHPALSNDENIMLRGVHDLVAHYAGRHKFTARGELGAYNRHLKTLPPKTFPVVFTEVVAQVAYYFCYGHFPNQKATILDDFDHVAVGKLWHTSSLNKFFAFERGALQPIPQFSWVDFTRSNQQLARALSSQPGFDPKEWESYDSSSDQSLTHGRSDSSVHEAITKTPRMYHVTYLHRLESIASSGLVPSDGGSNFSPGYAAHSTGKVFLCDWSAVRTWHGKLGDAVDQFTEPDSAETVADWLPVVLRIETQALDVDDDALGNRDVLGTKNFSHGKRIRARKIKVWNGQEWLLLSTCDLDDLRDSAAAKATEERDDSDDDSTSWWEIDTDIYLPDHR